ncbi:Uncharacterised protein [Candidatus Bilamarchaeum dharawalense]|uniref:BioF2-like acetyltransferase domain-containing protein n=1 Tax=Candidatus Bilamarchaeum dharawalense TaxID=2885759 RepID=A0A5E4LTT2_9ARCH|nr:Uncharacterised protein [Candidatus Bilamarchaeum dharawalense]
MMQEITLDEAKQIWDQYVPEKQVWTDDWEIRVALCKGYGCKPTIFYDGKNFFPLQYDSENNFYTIIGGESVEKNYLTFDPEFMKTTKEIPENIYFDFLENKFDGCTEGFCPQFFIDLTNMESIDDYIQRFSKKHKKNFRRACKLFGEYEFRKEGNLEKIAELNKKMFGEESDFNNETKFCYELLDRDQRTEYWSIIKNGKPVLTTQYFFSNRTMSVCIWGVDKEYEDTMKIALVEGIKLAKSRNCRRIDFAPTYSSWKLLYRLNTAPLWRYKRGKIPESIEIVDYGIPRDELEKLRKIGRL